MRKYGTTLQTLEFFRVKNSPVHVVVGQVCMRIATELPCDPILLPLIWRRWSIYFVCSRTPFVTRRSTLVVRISNVKYVPLFINTEQISRVSLTIPIRLEQTGLEP